MLNIILTNTNYDEKIFDDEYFIWGMRIPTPFIENIKKVFDVNNLKKYENLDKKIKINMVETCSNVIGLPPPENYDIKQLSLNIDSNEIVIRHGDSKNSNYHGLYKYGKRYNIGFFAHQTFQAGWGRPEPLDLVNGAGDIINIFCPIRNYLNLNEFEWFYSKNTHDMWAILHPELYRNLAYILIYYYTKIHNTTFENMKKYKQLLNKNVNKTFAKGTTPFPTAGLFQIFIGIYVSKNVYIYGANLEEKTFDKFRIGPPHCLKSEKSFLRDLVNKNMDHIPKKYFPFDLNNKSDELYREIHVVF